MSSPNARMRKLDANIIPATSSEVRAFACIKDENLRLPYLLEYHRRLGVGRFFFIDSVEIDPKAAAKHLSGDAIAVLAKVRAELATLSDWSAVPIHRVLLDLATNLQSGLGKIAQPVRVAVTGTAVSPPIDATLELLGRERTLARLDAALQRVSART